MSSRRTNQFIRQTKVGKIVKVVKEHYTRNDIACGYIHCTKCIHHVQQQRLTTSDSTYDRLGRTLDEPIDLTVPQYNEVLTDDHIQHHAKQSLDINLPTLHVIDTNVVLHQMDLLEQQYTSNVPIFNNLIMPQTVLDEVKHRSNSIYTRLRAVLTHHDSTHYVYSNEYSGQTYVQQQTGETINDRNDRAIRQVAKYYASHLTSTCNIILLTNDRLNQIAAHKDGIRCYTMQQYVQLFSKLYPTLTDQLARTEADIAEADKNSDNTSRPSWTYDEHLPRQQLDSGLAGGTLVHGTLRVSGNYFGEATVTVYKADGVTRQTIYLPTLKHVNRAVDNDVVAVQILPASDWVIAGKRLGVDMMDEADTTEIEASVNDMQLSDASNKSAGTNTAKAANTVCTGKVVGIVERRWRQYGGSLEVTDKKRGTVLFLPANKRIPKVRIDTKQIEQLMDKRVMVQIDAWPHTSHYPAGHYVKTIGVIGEREAETQLLLIEHDIRTDEWSNSVLQCLPAVENEIDQSHTVGRTDLRQTHNIVSIDPPGCTDIDDALHCRVMDNGNFEVGVHIADVSHYVKPDTAIDIEAQARGTSVYLVDRRIDMLPRQLSTNLCSLKSNIDRLTFSVTWEMTPGGDIVDTKFFKAVINSKRSFTYQQAQEAIDDKSDESDITKSLRQLNHIAKTLKQRRIDAGALMLASTEVKFLLDKQSSQPTDVEMYQLRDTNSLVEEFMLLANISVAKRTLQYYPAFALLRRHPTPTPDMLQPLIRAAAQAGFDIDISSSKALADCLDRCDVANFPFFNKLIRIMATRCMTQAVYFSSGDVQPSEYQHYGLAAAVYTHYTSPIRRYADIVVHRLLASSLLIDPLPASIQDRVRVHEMADTINYRHRMAQLVSRASAELYTMIYFYGKRVEKYATIVAVRANGVRIIVPRYGLEGNIKLSDGIKENASDAGESSLVYDDEAMTLVDNTNDYKFKIFEQVRVVIETQENKSRRRWLSITLHPDCRHSTPISELVKHTELINGDGDATDGDVEQFADKLTDEFVQHDAIATQKEIEMKHAADAQHQPTKPSIVDSAVKRVKT